MWMNPDMKVYITTITIDGVHDWLKPGMSAKVEIQVKTLTNVVYVPIQGVQPVDDKHYCLVEKGLTQERREVEVGEFNDEFIEIKKGIAEGERVALRAPESSDKGPGADAKKKENEKEKDQPPGKKEIVGKGTGNS
jgi:multidrug efflux pump subunit AcrA (membrane-fusion protein)